MEKPFLKSKRFIRFLLVVSCFIGIAASTSAQNLTNKSIDKSASGFGDLIGATTLSLADNDNATTQPNFIIGDVFSFPTGMSSITLNSIYTNGYGSWGTGGTNAAPRYAIVSNPNVLNSGYKSITDGVNRLIMRTPNQSTEMFRFRVEGHKPGENVSVQFTVQEITSNTVSGATPQLVVNIKEVGGNDYKYYPQLAQGGTLNFSQTTARNSGAIEVIVSRDNWNDGANFVYAISNINVYGTSYQYIDALNSTVCDGDNISLTAKGFEVFSGDYTWESSSTETGPFSTIAGEISSTINVDALLGNTFYKVTRGTATSEVFQLNARVCCKETAGQQIIFKEDFGTVASGTRKNFADIGSTGIVPLTYRATGNVDDGQYAIVSNTNDAEDFNVGGGHPWYWAGTDHTGDVDGGLLFINCGDNIKEKPVYVRTLDGAQLCNSTYLFFSLYMANPAKAGGAPSRFRLEIWGYTTPTDSTLVESLLTGDIVAGNTEWKQFGTSFLPGAFPELKVKVISLSDATIGNDVIIDDISVTVCAPSIAMGVNGNPSITETSVTCGNSTTLDVISLTDLSKLFTSTPYYRWEQSTDDGVSWTETTHSGIGVITATVSQNDETIPTIYRVIVAEDATSAETISDGIALSDVCATFGITNNVKVSCTPSNPVITLATDKTIICGGQENATLTVTVTAGNVVSCIWKYSENDGATWIDMTETETIIQVSPTVKTSYQVIGLNENDLTSNTETIVVDVTPQVTVSLATSAEKVILGGTATLTATTTPSSNTLAWTVNGSSLAATNPQTVSPYMTESYQVTATDGCTSATSELVEINVEWPTAFIPYSQDGLNDTFANGFAIIVFDRYGKAIFEGGNGWDGKVNGMFAQPAVYYYVVTLPNNQVKKGTIEVVKP
jgi:gliding motility-associated-like protein